MAKTKGESTGKMNRLRMIVIDSDLSDDAVTNLSQAIASALRMTQAVPAGGRTISAGTSHQITARNGAEPPTVDDEPDTPTIDDAEVPEERAGSGRSGPKAPRQYYKPKVVNVDLTGGDRSFEAYVVDKGSPTETTKRYLLVAAWFKLHRGTDAITVDHVYTCYRGVSWTLDFPDVAQPFRDLKRRGWGDNKNKQFTLNHIGEGVASKMTAPLTA
jgi:hypothetical protein